MPCTEPQSADYRQKYRNLKRKLKILIYENECFQEELKKAQRKLLKVARDKSFLLDRLLHFEAVESSTSDSDATVSSDSETEIKEVVVIKRKRASNHEGSQEVDVSTSGMSNIVTTDSKKKKPRKQPQTQKPAGPQNLPTSIIDALKISPGEGPMTSAEIERHLESKQAALRRELISDKVSLTVPVEMFSNDPSVLDCDISNGPAAESSPNNIAGGISEDDGLIIDLHD